MITNLNKPLFHLSVHVLYICTSVSSTCVTKYCHRHPSLIRSPVPVGQLIGGDVPRHLRSLGDAQPRQANPDKNVNDLEAQQPNHGTWPEPVRVYVPLNLYCSDDGGDHCRVQVEPDKGEEEVPVALPGIQGPAWKVSDDTKSQPE